MKQHIPTFKSLAEERRFWQTHDVTDFWDELTPVVLRFTGPKRAQSIRLTPIELRALRSLLLKLTVSGRPIAHAHRKS